MIVWCCDEAPGFKPARPQDQTFVGNIVQAMAAYGSGRLGEQAVPLDEAEHMIVIGSDRMMQAVGTARHALLAPYLEAGPYRDRLHQLADAVHDEGSLRPVPAAAYRSGDGRANGGFLLLQPGSAARPGRFPGAERTSSSEQHAGETDGAVDRPRAEKAQRAAGVSGGIGSAQAMDGRPSPSSHGGRHRIAATVIPEGRSPIRNLNALKRIFFCDTGSQLAWPG